MISFRCAWCLRKYFLELQEVEDKTFCCEYCRKEWEKLLNSSKAKS